MIQIYILSITYLLIGAMILLSDTYGGRFSLLLSVRYLFRTKRSFQTAMILAGFFLAILLGMFPVPPGPRLLGDLFPLVNTLLLMFWYLFQTVRSSPLEQDKQEKSVLGATGRYVEKNKRNFGFLTLAVAVLHFLFPVSVLL